MYSVFTKTSCSLLQLTPFRLWLLQDRRQFAPSPPTVEQLLSQKPSEKAAWRSRATPSLIPPKKIFYCMNHAASVNQDLFYFVPHWPKEVIVTAKRKAATKWFQDTELCLAGRISPLSLHPCLSPVAHLGQLQAWTWMRAFLFFYLYSFFCGTSVAQHFPNQVTHEIWLIEMQQSAVREYQHTKYWTALVEAWICLHIRSKIIKLF